METLDRHRSLINTRDGVQSKVMGSPSFSRDTHSNPTRSPFLFFFFSPSLVSNSLRIYTFFYYLYLYIIFILTRFYFRPCKLVGFGMTFFKNSISYYKINKTGFNVKIITTWVRDTAISMFTWRTGSLLKLVFRLKKYFGLRNIWNTRVYSKKKNGIQCQKRKKINIDSNIHYKKSGYW